MDNLHIRSIAFEDNATIASIIRQTLKEFGADRPGTVYYDDSTDHLYELFQMPNSAYFIAEMNGDVIGGAGIYPTEGLPENTCELVKMYLLPEARGKGIASKLIAQCMEMAKKNNFAHIYLESMPELKAALAMYESKGWRYLSQPMGNSGHTGCQLWMLLDIN